MHTIGVIGAGAWGTALAQVLTLAGKSVTLWAREAEVATAIAQRHENPAFLPGVSLSPSLRVTADLMAAASSDILLITTPAQHVRATLNEIKELLVPGRPVVLCAKGVEIDTGLLLSEVAKQVAPGADIAVLTGPTFAAEIARGLPSAVTIAGKKETTKMIVSALKNKTLRLYSTDDLIGAQIGGAVKNVIAIACGVVHGKGLGESARAALVTRGLAEMSRLAAAMGAKKETLMGMCGVGDMILTCSSMQSRNFSLGAALGQGKNTTEILKQRSAVTEGVHTAKALKVMARTCAVDMPISSAVYELLHNNASVDAVMEQMMERPAKKEAA